MRLSYSSGKPDPMALSHQIALTGRVAGAEEIVRGVSLLQLKCVLRGATAKRLGAIPYPAILSLKKGGFAVLGVGSAKDLVRLIDPIGRIAKDVSLEDAQALSSDELVLITRRLGRRSQHLRLSLVLAVASALQALARPCAGRVAVCATVRFGGA